jgi:hypothetical protein
VCECRTLCSAFINLLRVPELIFSFSKKATIKPGSRTLELIFCSLNSIALGYGLDDRGSIPGGGWEFLFTAASRTALGLTQPPIQWVPGALSLG